MRQLLPNPHHVELLTKSTLFFLNLHWHIRGGLNKKTEVFAKVKGWQSFIKSPDSNGPPLPSVTSPSHPSIASGESQISTSTKATSISKNKPPALPLDIPSEDEEASYGVFGEDGDDSKEQEGTLNARKKNQVSGFAMSIVFLTNLQTIVDCRGYCSATKAEGQDPDPQMQGD